MVEGLEVDGRCPFDSGLACKSVGGGIRGRKSPGAMYPCIDRHMCKAVPCTTNPHVSRLAWKSKLDFGNLTHFPSLARAYQDVGFKMAM